MLNAVYINHSSQFNPCTNPPKKTHFFEIISIRYINLRSLPIQTSTRHITECVFLPFYSCCLIHTTQNFSSSTRHLFPSHLRQDAHALTLPEYLQNTRLMNTKCIHIQKRFLPNITTTHKASFPIINAFFSN